MTYAGYGGQEIKGWLLLPRQREEPLPCVVEYIGYGGGRATPLDWLPWSSAGYAHLVMDTRGQGSAWKPGDTPDIAPAGNGPHYPGFMTLGVLDKETYYYRRVFTDAVRAVEAARSHPAVDAGRVAITGGSQGGGITLAVAGLLPDVGAAMPDVPFLCHYRRATEIGRHAPVLRDRTLLQDLPRPGGHGLRHALVFRRDELRGPRAGCRAVLDGPDGRHLPAVHSVRGLQPLCWREQVHQRLAVQQPRGRRNFSVTGTDQVPEYVVGIDGRRIPFSRAANWEKGIPTVRYADRHIARNHS